jgi:hypothetical protein
MSGLKNTGTIDLVTDLEVAAGASVLTDPLPVGLLHHLHIYLTNTGAANSVTVLCRASCREDCKKFGDLQPMTLGAGTDTEPWGVWFPVYSEAVPSFIFAKIINNDQTNPAKITITLDRWR